MDTVLAEPLAQSRCRAHCRWQSTESLPSTEVAVPSTESLAATLRKELAVPSTESLQVAVPSTESLQLAVQSTAWCSCRREQQQRGQREQLALRHSRALEPSTAGCATWSPQAPRCTALQQQQGQGCHCTPQRAFGGTSSSCVWAQLLRTRLRSLRSLSVHSQSSLSVQRCSSDSSRLLLLQAKAFGKKKRRPPNQAPPFQNIYNVETCFTSTGVTVKQCYCTSP